MRGLGGVRRRGWGCVGSIEDIFREEEDDMGWLLVWEGNFMLIP